LIYHVVCNFCGSINGCIFYPFKFNLLSMKVSVPSYSISSTYMAVDLALGVNGIPGKTSL
jgi:hypothetical protein